MGRGHNVELVATPTSASLLNRIDATFRPLREFVLNASDYASHADVAVAFRRYLSGEIRPSHQPHPFARIQVKSCLTVH